MAAGMKVSAKYLRFRLREVFPPEQRESRILLKLVAATNDARRLQCLIRTVRAGADRLNDLEKRLREGELLYLFRILCGHLYEAGNAFRKLSTRWQDRIERINSSYPGAKAAFDFVSQIYSDTAKTGFFEGVLGAIRCEGAFHYDYYRQDAFEDLPSEAELVVADAPELSRYRVTDLFMAKLLVSKLGGNRAVFRKALERALKLGIMLGASVDYLLIDRLTSNADAILEKRSDEMLEIAPWLPAKDSQRE